MNVAIVGYGRMGHQVAEILIARGHHVASIVDPMSHDEPTAREFPGLSHEALEGCDVAIEFSLPDAVASNVSSYVESRVPAVIGTTGWFESADAILSPASDAGIGVVYGSNFSIGAHVFFRAARYAASLVSEIDDYDLLVHEMHHRKKVDSPSGTALTLAREVVEAVTRKTAIVTDKLDRAPEPNELHVSSSRVGSVPGTHALVMDSTSDTIEVRHQARNRGGFALGAVLASEWVVSNPGIHPVEDFMAALLREEE